MLTNFTSKNIKYFICEKCDFKCCKKGDYNRHLLTGKHIKLTETNTILHQNTSEHICEQCKKIYKSRVGLWSHKKKCLTQEATNELSDKNLILTLIQQNNELQKQILEVCKNVTINTTNSHNTNSHNKTFNLQFFLNEECKDALNIAEFVSSIKMDLDDLETTGRLGYVEGVSRIINKNLNDLDQTKRPIHCSDVKREVLYIKNDDQWIKENETKPILTKAIKQIANENIKQIGEWRKKYPDCTDSDSRKNDLYLNIVSNAMSGSTSEEQSTNYEKIITKVAKEVVIEK
jgi:hypothetical protein